MLSQIDKQVVRSWYGRYVAPLLSPQNARHKGPRIAVIGNCQSYGVAYSMKLLNPLAEVHHFSAIGKSRTSVALFAKTLESYDYVFSHPFEAGHLKDGGSVELKGRFNRLELYPAITFQAFHPDTVYLLDDTNNYAQLLGPLGPYQSALAVFAYRKGLSVQEANALFNRDVYEAVGYFNVWDDAAKELLGYASHYGMDLSFELTSWARRGVFMYSSVHPKSFVLFDVAKKLFGRVGLPIRELDFDYYTIHDLARSEIFPIYPAIAEMFGVRGSYLFKVQNHHLSAGVGTFYNLPQYLDASYKIYEKSQTKQMRHPRIDGWLDNAAFSDELVRLARENLRRGLTPSL